MSIMPPGPDSKTSPPHCATAGCPNPGTVYGNYDDGEISVWLRYCPECAGYLYEVFTPTGDDGDDEFDCGHHSWAGLMALLDEHWPADIFPTRYPDDIKRDAGARIVSLIRWVDRLRGDAR